MYKAWEGRKMALDREEKLTVVGGVVGAAAKEMGRQWATIKRVETELEDELEEKADIQEDERLIREQAVRL